MPSIGETLRDARMRQHMDIADVEARTKIRAKYLRALENEEFAMLPGSTFVKTFLRTYAEQLGLDPHLLVEEYRANYEGPDEAELQPLTPPAVSRRERERRRGPRPPGRLPIVIGAVLAVLVFLVILGWDRGGNDNGGGDSQPAAKTETTAKKPGKAKPKRTKPRRKPKPAVATNVSLKIVPQGDTYLCVDKGQGTPKLFEGTINSPRSFKGKRIRLNLGRTAVQITLNGKRFSVPQSGEPAGFDFTPKGGKPVPVGQRPCA
jgi:cytoskeletal protein RodZ